MNSGLQATIPHLVFTALCLAAVAGLAADETHVTVDDAWNGATGCHLSGRLTEVHPAPADESQSLETLYRNSRLMLNQGEAGAITCGVAGHTWALRTDAEGYWELALSPPLALSPGWHDITTKPVASSRAGLLVVEPANRLGLISDIDDTILVSDVPNKPVLLKNSLGVPAGRRIPVPGMAELYARLLRANPAPEASAVFYVSASPKQLTDNLRKFLSHNRFPRGVLQLKEFSGSSGESLFDQRDYKLRALETIFREYPQVRFALFGDDGEQDPEIYAALQAKFPGQVEGVWIRRVNPDPARVRFPAQKDVAELLPR